jgi:hypothetical protein
MGKLKFWIMMGMSVRTSMSIIIRKKPWKIAQVRKLWEVLLYAQPGWGDALRQQVVEGLVRARLVGGVTSTKRVAEGKRIFDIPNGFLMTKVRRSPRLCPNFLITLIIDPLTIDYL